jgi:hypothetical protein
MNRSVKRGPRKTKTNAKDQEPLTEQTQELFSTSMFEENTQSVIPKVPKAKKSRKPPVIASVTPDGIKGSLSLMNEQRPLIAHLPIHSTDLVTDMFAPEIKPDESLAQVHTPSPYDPEDVYVSYRQDTIKHDESVFAEVQESTLSFRTKEEMPEPTAGLTYKEVLGNRPSLPLYYSEKVMIRFQDANRDQKVPDTTDVACFWDCHSFREKPFVIPTIIQEDIWKVYGNFCSPECAASYLFQERLDSHVQWERYALLNRLYSTEGTPIRLAPSRNILRLFGGTLDISDFRNITGDHKMRIDVMTPPMISIIQVMDTKPIDFYDASMKNTFIPWEMDRMNRPGAQGLRLRRTKPVSEKETTLEFCMGITT